MAKPKPKGKAKSVAVLPPRELEGLRSCIPPWFPLLFIPQLFAGRGRKGLTTPPKIWCTFVYFFKTKISQLPDNPISTTSTITFRKIVIANPNSYLQQSNFAITFSFLYQLQCRALFLMERGDADRQRSEVKTAAKQLHHFVRAPRFPL